MSSLKYAALAERETMQKETSYIDYLLKKEIEKNDKKIIVLDDDPTGTQTVHGISVYTDWSKSSVRDGFAEEKNLFYILTNSRSLTEVETEKAHREISRTIQQVSNEKGKDFILISRSDSTLRGHFPLETETMKSVLDKDRAVDGEIICPFFAEGGRYTIDDIHYVKDGEWLIPASETEFAKDRTFGYNASNLKDYIAEKTANQFSAKTTCSISLEMLRNVEIDRVERLLLEINDFNKVVVNAIDDVDLKVFCVAFYRALGKGKRFIIRSAASLVKVLGGIEDMALLRNNQLLAASKKAGGLVVIGSYAEKTTRQLNELRKMTNAVFIQFDSACVTDATAFESEQRQVIKAAEAGLTSGSTTVIFTRRKALHFDGDTKETILMRSVKISEAVQTIVANIKIVPKFIIAKGGITSSDIATKALKIKKATVAGQIRPGIPVWKSESENVYKNMPYIIFPGNVGEDQTLREVTEQLAGY